MSLLAVCVVLWVVGGMLVRRSAGRAPEVSARAKSQPGLPAGAKAQQGQPTRRGRAQPKQAAPVDEDMAEIEAILKSRGID